jgi:hypothetical protein
MSKELSKAKHETLAILRDMQAELVRVVNEGMVDTNDEYYNEILDLISDAKIADSNDVLEEIITRGKTLETDIAAFLSREGVTTVSRSWPNI